MDFIPLECFIWEVETHIEHNLPLQSLYKVNIFDTVNNKHLNRDIEIEVIDINTFIPLFSK